MVLDVSDKGTLVGRNLCQGKYDYETGSIFHSLLLVAKINYFLTINEVGIIEEHNFFRGFNDCIRLLDRSQIFNMLVGEKLSAMLPKS